MQFYIYLFSSLFLPLNPWSVQCLSVTPPVCYSGGWFVWLARLAVAGRVAGAFSCGWFVWLARLAVAGRVGGAFGCGWFMWQAHIAVAAATGRQRFYSLSDNG